eukprot:5775519-Pleurochrysis_carterae.AAC.1
MLWIEATPSEYETNSCQALFISSVYVIAAQYLFCLCHFSVALLFDGHKAQPFPSAFRSPPLESPHFYFASQLCICGSPFPFPPRVLCTYYLSPLFPPAGALLELGRPDGLGRSHPLARGQSGTGAQQQSIARLARLVLTTRLACVDSWRARTYALRIWQPASRLSALPCPPRRCS